MIYISGCQPRIQLIVHCKNIIVKITILLFSTVAKNLIVSCMIVQIIMYTCMLMPYLFAVIITTQLKQYNFRVMCCLLIFQQQPLKMIVSGSSDQQKSLETCKNNYNLIYISVHFYTWCTYCHSNIMHVANATYMSN